MSLKRAPFLILDCQTTGMRPSVGRILEIAWTVADAECADLEVHSHLIELPEGEEIPSRVRELTGIGEDDMRAARPREEVFAALAAAVAGLGDPKCALIHYAQFEKPFLADLFGCAKADELPFSILCSHALTKKLFPDLPSQNIRGTAGFFGDPVGSVKRAAAHVRATHQIWRGLCARLEQEGISTREGLQAFLSTKKKTAKGRYQYRIGAEQRLNLPDRPGIYRMIAKSGEVLYVGKATSLKSRVNSYFRGKAGRDKRKLEMLAQVWDLQVTECRSALEAALLEADEIKKFNPPYNVVMKKGRRHLVFYSRDFSSAARAQDEHHLLGPFRNSNWIEHLRALERSLRAESFEQIFFDYVPAEQLRAAWGLFLNAHQLPALNSVRSMLAFGLNLHRVYEEPDEVEEAVEVEEEVEVEVSEEFTDEEVAGKFERLLRRAGAEYHRSRRLTRLLNARVTYRLDGEDRRLEFANGYLKGTRPGADSPFPWHGLDIETYDRMSVLLSELDKYDHSIEV